MFPNNNAKGNNEMQRKTKRVSPQIASKLSTSTDQIERNQKATIETADIGLGKNVTHSKLRARVTFFWEHTNQTRGK